MQRLYIVSRDVIARYMSPRISSPIFMSLSALYVLRRWKEFVRTPLTRIGLTRRQYLVELLRSTVLLRWVALFVRSNYRIIVAPRLA